MKVLILTGEGRSFCAGGDNNNFVSPGLKTWKMKKFPQEKVHIVVHSVESLDKPLIAAINRPAYMVGMDGAFMCDIRITSGKAEFCESHINIGMAQLSFYPRLWEPLRRWDGC